MMSLTTERNRDFMARCHKITQQHNSHNKPALRVITQQAVTSRAPGYYVSFNHAYKSLTDFNNGKLPQNTSPLKFQMWTEISNKVSLYKARHHKASTADALARVLTTSASRFFITPVYALRLFHHLNNPYESRKKQSTLSNNGTRLNKLLNNSAITVGSKRNSLDRQFDTHNGSPPGKSSDCR